MPKFQIRRRDNDGSRPLVTRLLEGRGASANEFDYSLKNLLPYSTFKGIDAAAEMFADAIQSGSRCTVLADYDADGCTGGVLAVAGLRALGAVDPGYLVPNRFTMGYGMSPLLVDMAAERGTDLVFTVDNGIASHAGVARARGYRMECLITDHHLAGATIPDADAIVNPNQPGCEFGSKHLTGVGVMFYTLCAVRQKLKESGWFEDRPMPNMADYLDLVALGTIGDVAKLDYNNRILVEQGLRRIRSGYTRPGIQALMQVAGVIPKFLTAQDVGFKLTPRLNCAGRLDDMRVGIECLLADSFDAALPIAAQLDAMNRDRRAIEGTMREDAEDLVRDSQAKGIVLHSDTFHEGVVGLVAGRVKEDRHRPTFAFAPAADGLLKGSGRSIPGFHLRDALAAIDAQNPGLLTRYGGHAMACGATLEASRIEDFRLAFERFCEASLTPAQLDRVLLTDGELAPDELTVQTALDVEGAGPWGQGFEEPVFEGNFEVVSARAVGEDGKHAQYQLRAGSVTTRAVHFGGGPELRSVGSSLPCAYRLGINRFRGSEALDLQIVEAL